MTCSVVTQETPCDDEDNDCDGETDESFVTKRGTAHARSAELRMK